MKIITVMPGHNSTVGVFEDGNCLAIYQEEKFTDIKNYVGFPSKSFDSGIKLLKGKVDLVAITHQYLLPVNLPNPQRIEHNKFSHRGYLRKVYDFFDYSALGWATKFLRNFLIKIISPILKEKIHAYLHNKYGIDKKQIFYYDHHLTHCVTPLAFYGLDGIHNKVLLLSMDGAGDNAFTKTYIFDSTRSELKIVSQSSYRHSIGLLYSSMTRFLGMRPTEHEYKVMGLAAYVTNPSYYDSIYKNLSKLINFDSKTLKFKGKFNMDLADKYFRKHLSGERFDNMAAGVQKVTEDLVVDWVKHAIKNTGINVVACSGGVFMNVKLNQRISELPEIKKIYFQPSCGDESHVVGGAYLAAKELRHKIKPLNSMFYGHHYSNQDVESFIAAKKLSADYQITYHSDVDVEIAKLLSEHQIVARFKGAGEWGARSLCNRGILANASDLSSFYYVNDAIKMRDFWMPFAPTILDLDAPRYIKNWDEISSKIFESLKYMIITVDATDLAKKHLRAAMHQKDFTIRPQIVTKLDNPDLYKLLERYRELTGMGGIMNTSFNLHGSPLVGTLDQALDTFKKSGIQWLVLENYILKK